MPSFTTLSLSVAILLAGLITARCATNPNGDRPRDSPLTDRIRFMSGAIPKVGAHALRVFFAYHAALVLVRDDQSQLARVCPRPDHLSGSPSQLFAWTPATIIPLIAIAVGGWIRLSAYAGLGPNFTFALSKPDRLITSGWYAWLQHPSYTGLLLVTPAHIALATRWDAAPACVLSDAALEALHGWGLPIATLVMGATVGLIATRVRDEERMLQQRFGREWEQWHRRTARLIPGIF